MLSFHNTIDQKESSHILQINRSGCEEGNTIAIIRLHTRFDPIENNPVIHSVRVKIRVDLFFTFTLIGKHQFADPFRIIAAYFV